MGAVLKQDMEGISEPAGAPVLQRTLSLTGVGGEECRVGVGGGSRRAAPVDAPGGCDRGAGAERVLTRVAEVAASLRGRQGL